MSKPLILLVDDDRLVLATTAKGLRNAGYDVIDASSGEEALQLLEQNTPNLAVFDIRMPGMNGLETAQRISKKYSVPFLIFSAYGDTGFVNKAVDSGALGYLIKPIDVAHMIPTIETALQRAQDIKKLKDTEGHLQNALTMDRNTSTAVGLLMERYRLDKETAFEMLRRHARSQRRKLADVATELVNATEKINAFDVD